MSKRMKGSLPYLQVMGKCGPKLRKFMINNVPLEVITAICECSLNLFKGVIPLSPRQKRRLARQRLMYPKILQETWKDGIRFRWAVRLARKRLFLRHRHRDHRHQHHHVQVPQNISVVYSEDRRRNQNNGFLIKKCCNCLHVLIKMFLKPILY